MHHMLAATTPADLVQLAKKLRRNGCRGVLISGGASCDGSVPLLPFSAALKELNEMGLSVMVHPGLLDDAMATMLARAGVHGAALDLIGDIDTIREVYHLKKSPDNYRHSLRSARRAGLAGMPHIVAGLHYGKIRGEYAAVDMVAEEGANCLIFVVLQPLPKTKMQNLSPPDLQEVKSLFHYARRLLPKLPLILGCARPPGVYAGEVERMAVDAGFNAIAYPASETVAYVQSSGLKVLYRENCCETI